ncbi:MAG: hypothetical protein EOO43_01865 [Flavobacterium sp.]|nr:MAG: hypothetical protein EOO43_01865 [Flavobacterium sp.]
MVNSLRKWLTKNKIFFEVVAFSVFSLTAILVAYKANLIADAQTHIMRKTAVPQVGIVMTSDNNNVDKVYKPTWYVFNTGGKISNINITTYSMIHLDSYTSDTLDKIGYPLYGYLNFRTQITGEAEGHVATIDNGDSALLEQKLRTDLTDIAYFNVQCYARITFKDIFDEHHVTYFKLGIENERLTTLEWYNIEQHWNDSKVKLTLQTLNKDTVLKLLK